MSRKIMKNEYIEVVRRWIAGEDFSVEEMEVNAEAAEAAYVAAGRAVRVAAHAAYVAADIDAARAARDIEQMVNRYEEFTK